MSAPAIIAERLYKRFDRTEALRGLNLTAEEGTVLGVLGPNGAARPPPCEFSRHS